MNRPASKTYLVIASIAIVAAAAVAVVGGTVSGVRLVLIPPKQGVQGQATMRFISGVPRAIETQSRDSAGPFSGTIYVFKGHSIGRRPNLKDAYVVANAVNGTFKIRLEPGDYSLVMQSDDGSPTDITITPDVWLQVTLSGEIMGC